ncbi:MAG: SpoIIE family protein phosphatase, partial [Verrucomicrobiales bacterium]
GGGNFHAMNKDGHEGGGNTGERMVLALRASNEGIWDWTVGERKIYYSRRILEFLECSESSAPNLFLPPHDAVHPEERGSFESVVRQSMDFSGPETLAIDCRVLTGGGGWRWLRIRGSVVRDRTGQATRIAGSMIDISRRKEAEAQVEEERHLLKQLIDHVPLQIYFKDLDSRFVLANRRMVEWMGLRSQQDLIGKSDRNFFDEMHWKAAEADERQILGTAEPITDKLECETWRESGEETWVQTSKFPWRDRHGHVKGTFGVSGNVTELVKARQEAYALAAELTARNEVYEEELQLAREIQQALSSSRFPKVSDGRGTTLMFSSRYVPSSGLAGDFFEAVPVSDGAVGLLICDVMGHGVRSALIVAMLRGLLEKQRGQAADPGAFLSGLNEGLCAILARAGTTMFATAFYVLLDLTKDTLTYACAGHPGAVVEGPGGTHQLAAEKSAKGPGLGLFSGAEFPVGSLPLDQVKRLLLFTDGIIEAQNAEGEAFFERRLLEAVTGSSASTLDGMLDGVLGSVLEFSGSQHFEDDVCMLGIEIQRAKD